VDGETNPLSETKVDFTILPSAPLGRNEVTVYLRGNDKIDVPLTLNIKVTGNVPDWAVNPYDYESSMNVIGRLIVDGVASDDSDDILAAFIGEECRGIVHPHYNERYGSSYITMDIYGNNDEDAQDVTFRAYDASTGTVYPVVYMNNAESIKFQPLTLSGSYATPDVLATQNLLEQQIELKAGWNWISFYVTAADMTVQKLFEKVAEDVLTVKSQSKFMMYGQNQWDGNLMNALSNGEMYAVKMNADRTLRIVGTRSNSTPTISEYWNWIGYTGLQVASLGDALADMNKTNGDIVKAQSGVAYWDTYEWSGSLLLMEPGKGYQVYKTPAAGVKAYGAPQVSGESSNFTPIDFRMYPDNAIMAVKVVANGMSMSDIEVGVFAGEECRAAEVTNELGIAYLTIPGDETCELTIKVAVGSEVMDASLTLTYESNAEYGTPASPMVLDLTDVATGIGGMGDGQDSDVYDISGRKMDSRKLQRGVYIINGQKKTVK